VQSTDNSERSRRLNARVRRWRTLHLVTGFVIGLWLLAMAATGVLINHQEEWGLLEIEVSNDRLPDHYTTEFRPEATPLNVVLADLHSGRFFGEQGRLIADLVGLLVLVSVASGTYAYWLRWRLTAGVKRVRRAAAPERSSMLLRMK